MTVIRKDLGTVTAYAYAVSKGYTGTEAEFAELMASYADVAEEAAQSASDAENAAARAEAAAATLTVDDALSDTSVNPVQNKVITGEVTQVKSHLDGVADDLRDLIGLFEFSWEQGGLASATGIEYSSTSNVRTKFTAVSGAKALIVTNKNLSGTNAALYEFASNQTTASGTNERLAVTYIAPNTTRTIILNSSTAYIRCQVPSGNTSDGENLLVYAFDGILADDYNAKITNLKKLILYRNFVLVDNAIASTDESTFIDRLSAIHSIKLIGFDGYEKCRLRYICRNHSTMNYRFIICGYDGTEWKDIFDTLPAFTVTENANGDTIVAHTIGTMTVIMSIDYSAMMSTGAAWLIDMPTDPYRYIISPNAFFPRCEKGLYAQLLNNNLSVIFQYSDTEVMKVEFYPFGINGLFSPHKISKKTSAVLTSDFSGFSTMWQEIYTDIVSPYAGLIDTAHPRSSVMTVGGNHGTNGAGGFPTATRLSYAVYVDGKQLKDKDVISGDSVTVVVKTNIAASNTINTETGAFTPAMEETASWIITPQNIEVSVMMKALTDISILGYTGLQAVCDSYDSVYFNDGTAEKAMTGVRIDSATYPGYSGDRSIMTNDNNEVYVLYTDRNVGVGNLSHLASGSPVSFVSAYDKLYQHLVKSNPLNLAENETAVYRGGFSVMPSYDCTGAKSAYFIKLNGEKIYCVDFLSSGSTYVTLPIECIGKQITVAEKSSSITVDQIVTGAGLFVSASGHGTLKFKIAQAEI